MTSVELGAVVAQTLAQLGVAGVVTGVGSRNAPLSMAFHRLDADGTVPLHVVLDERSAAFRALGLAKATGKLAAVAVTSGSAVANLHPAVLEARHAGVPMLVLTADRPMELVGSGASQTADQVGIFGPSVLGTVRLSSNSGDGAAWSAAVQRAAHLALGTRTREPGPVHVNLEFTPPLVGQTPTPDVHVAHVSASRGDDIVELSGTNNTVVMVGEARPSVGAEARALAELAGVPLLAEPASNARAGNCAIRNYRRLLNQELAKDVERVIVFGHPTLSRPQLALLARGDVEVIVVTDRATWSDTGHRASIVADRVDLEPQDPAWLARWREADASVAPNAAWNGRAVADEVLAAAGPDDNLVFGASNLIRDADLSPISATPPTTWASRGQAGIDGTIATATGIALGSGRRTTVLLGDLTAQHDIGSLARPDAEPKANLRIVIGDDNGGSLFHKLEQGRPDYADAFERVFGTPQDVDLAAVAGAFGWMTTVATSRADLQAALASEAECIVARYPRP